MTIIEITRVEDVRAGDLVTLSEEGHEYSGIAWAERDVLRVGPVGFRDLTGASTWLTFVRATREVPDLPTKPGSVIVNVTAPGPGFKGVAEYPYGVLKCEGLWRLFTADGRFGDRGANEIGAWTPARIVPEDGAS